MSCTRRDFVSVASGAALAGLVACAPQVDSSQEISSSGQEEPVEEPQVDLNEFKELQLDAKAWEYDDEHDVYYQLGIPYCLKPGSTACESLAVFVPGAYFTAEKHGKKAYACEPDPSAKVGSFTPATAPVLMPINSGTLGAQMSPTSYSYEGLEPYLSAGYIYVYAGFRGRSSGYESREIGGGDVFSGGAPWPIVDLKAAVRFLRYNASLLPCDVSKVFTFGFSMGGGVSALMGASGDSELYLPYLELIGAATHDAEGETLSDAVFGSASWCPITSFDTSDAAYEWMMGQYATNNSRAEGTWTKLLSSDLATAYGVYINEMDLRDEQDEALTLDETAGEIYAAGTYYNYLAACIEDAATTFFTNTTFPYTYTPAHLLNASFPGDPNLQSEAAGTSDIEAITGDASAQAARTESDIVSGVVDFISSAQPVVYQTDTDYVDELNGSTWWLTYNQRREIAYITSIGDFVRQMKVAAKDVCAFDGVNRSTAENQLFGVEDAGSLHFSQMVCDQLVEHREAYAEGEGWDDVYVQDWTGDLTEVDVLEETVSARVDLFNPLYFLSGRYEGFGSAQVAPHWRINSGLFQTDTSLCTEANLALALKHYDGVSDVAFTPVWGQGHVLAEAAGTAEENLISWIADCCK